MKVKLMHHLGCVDMMPEYATEGAVGLDLRVASATETVLKPNGEHVFYSGIAVEIPEGYGGFLFPRSGLGTKHGIVLRHTVGIIDSDYRGEIMIPLWNTSQECFIVQPYMRVAQLVLLPVVTPALTLVEDLAATERGEGGFGSTGLA